MTNEEIVQGLKFTAEEGCFIDADPTSVEQAHRAVRAAIARLSATCETNCSTCKWFHSTANKARFPNANTGVCRKAVLEDNDGHPLGVWETFYCNLHTPRAEER